MFGVVLIFVSRVYVYLIYVVVCYISRCPSLGCGTTPDSLGFRPIVFFIANVIWNIMVTLSAILFSKICTKLVRSLTVVVRNLTNLVRNTIPKWSSIDLYDQIHPRRREAPPRGVFSNLGCIFDDHFGIVFRTTNKKIKKKQKRGTKLPPTKQCGHTWFQGALFGHLQSNRIKYENTGNPRNSKKCLLVSRWFTTRCANLCVGSVCLEFSRGRVPNPGPGQQKKNKKHRTIRTCIGKASIY